MNLFFTVGFKGPTQQAEAVPLYAGRDKEAADRAALEALNGGTGIVLAMRYLAPAHAKIHRLTGEIVLPVLEQPEGEVPGLTVEEILAGKDAEIEKLKGRIAAAAGAGPSEEDAKAMIARIGELEAANQLKLSELEELGRRLVASEAAAVVVPGPGVDEAPVIVEAAEATADPVVEEAAAEPVTEQPAAEAKPPKGKSK